MIVITTTSDLKKTSRLIESLERYGYSYHIIEHEWYGFNGKLHETYKFLKTTKETHFIYTDAWDSIVLRPCPEPWDGFLISAEWGCYPHPEKAKKYPKVKTPWKYVNGGGWGGEVSAFLKLYESKPPDKELNDQVWMTDRYLENSDWIKLDTGCEIFQTISAFNPTWFDWVEERRGNVMTFQVSGLRNKKTNSFPYFWHGNAHTDLKNIYNKLPMNLEKAQAVWTNTVEGHKFINETFRDKVNETPLLKKFRDYIEPRAYGFGERSFIWLWHILCDSLPSSFKFLEIGVYRGQSLAAVKLCKPSARCTGITPLDPSGGFPESDYAKDISDLHKEFKLKQPTIIKGYSQDDEVLARIARQKAFDMIYIDGSHDYQDVWDDVYKYSSFVKVGGLLVIDDCADKYPMPFGYFTGIKEVSAAVDDLLPNEYYEEILSVVHIRVFRRIK